MTIKNRSTLRLANAYAATRWIDDHRAEVATMQLAEIADAITKSTGVAVTESNVRGICDANGFDWRKRSTSRIDAERRPPSKQVRFLAMQVRRIAVQIDSLNRAFGVEVPKNLEVDIDGLIRLSRGSTALIVEDTETMSAV